MIINLFMILLTVLIGIALYVFIRVELVGDFRERLYDTIKSVSLKQWQYQNLNNLKLSSEFESDYWTLYIAFSKIDFKKMLFSFKPLTVKYWFTKEETMLFNKYSLYPL